MIDYQALLRNIVCDEYLISIINNTNYSFALDNIEYINDNCIYFKLYCYGHNCYTINNRWGYDVFNQNIPKNVCPYISNCLVPKISDRIRTVKNILSLFANSNINNFSIQKDDKFDKSTCLIIKFNNLNTIFW